MDLSIRVIALILLATNVASHQDTHTYRLSKFLKITHRAVSFNPSAAEKRDYEAFKTTRQPLFTTPRLAATSKTTGQLSEPRILLFFIDLSSDHPLS